MRSSQNSAGAPFSANFFAQNVFPAPDMPTSASRMGLSLLVSRRIREFSTIACARRGSNPPILGLSKNCVQTWNLSSRTACDTLTQVVRLKTTRLLLCSPVRRVCRSEEHTSELQSRLHLVCRLLLEKKQNTVHRDIAATDANT